jgi:hypothetical protein
MMTTTFFVVQDMPANHCLSGGNFLSDEVGILKEFQEIEMIFVGYAEESSFSDCHQWRSVS